jgi:hypothetical protein
MLNTMSTRMRVVVLSMPIVLIASIGSYLLSWKVLPQYYPHISIPVFPLATVGAMLLFVGGAGAAGIGSRQMAAIIRRQEFQVSDIPLNDYIVLVVLSQHMFIGALLCLVQIYLPQ